MRPRQWSRQWSAHPLAEQLAILAEAAGLRAAVPPVSWEELALRYDLNRETLRRQLQPGFRETKAQVERQARAKRPADGLKRVYQKTKPPESRPISKDELARRLAEIPEDTRTLSARLLGEPLPGRSALDQERASSRGEDSTWRS